jgi:hypothetical protein
MERPLATHIKLPDNIEDIIRPHLLDSEATILILLMHLRCMNRKEPWILFEIHKNEHRFIGCKGHPPTSSRKS